MRRPEPALSFTIPSVNDGTTLQCRVFHPPCLEDRPATNARDTRRDANADAAKRSSGCRGGLHAGHTAMIQGSGSDGQRLTAKAKVRWKGDAAVVAHPYAPMGGSYDDPVVEAIVERLLWKGFVVGTFNFRGAGSSTGRTSWTAKAERDDYASFVGFMAYYVHHLDRKRCDNFTTDGGAEVSRRPDAHETNGRDNDASHRKPVLLLGGYSYGSMIATQLPPLETTLNPFNAPSAESHAAQIRLRAESLAAQQSVGVVLLRGSQCTTQGTGSAEGTAGMHVRQSRGSPMRGVRVGGEEASPTASGAVSPARIRHGSEGSAGRVSGESAGDRGGRSHKGVSDVLARTGVRRRGRSREAAGSSPGKVDGEEESSGGVLPAVRDMTDFKAAYLLVSPIPGLVTHLLTLSLLPSSLSFARHQSRHDQASHTKSLPASSSNSTDDALTPEDAKLVHNPTLAIYGDRDGFASAAKLRAWAGRLEGWARSRFRGQVVATAGHFWVEEGVLGRMTGMVDGFAEALMEGDG